MATNNITPPYYNNNAYPFTGIMFIDKLKRENIENYFMVKTNTLPEYKIYSTQDVRYKGLPAPIPVNNFNWNSYQVTVFLSDNYFEYKYLLNWLQIIKQNRDQGLHNVNVDLLSDITLFILDTKEKTIQLGIKFKNCYPESINSLSFSRNVSPLTLQLTFKYLEIVLIDEDEYKDVKFDRLR